MEVLSSSTDKTKELAGRIAKQLVPGDVLALYGDLGSGKTTFTRHLVDALGIDARVQSPTFVIVRKYSIDAYQEIKIVNHVDLYRINLPEEVQDIGLGELFSAENAITVIEWPELAEDLLPKNIKSIYFKDVDEGIRLISSKDFGDIDV